MKQARSRKKGDFFKKLKLSTRMSLFLGVITFLFLTALLYYLIHSFEIAIDKKIDDNLSDKAKSASSSFESVVSNVESISDNLLYGVQMILSAPPETPGAAPVNPWKIATADGAEPESTAPMGPVTLRSQIVNSEISYSKHVLSLIHI